MFTGMNYVFEVYKEKSFSKAADNLYISQPALSAAIKKIEKKIGAPLFDRSTNPIQLTECGEKYIETAEKILDLEDEFACHMGNLNELKAGHLSIGGTYFFVSFIFPPLIEKFTKKYPFVKLSVFDTSTMIMEQKLFSGDLDIVIDNYLFDTKIYHRDEVFQEHLLLAVPANFAVNQRLTSWQLNKAAIQRNLHRQASFPGVALKEFQNEPFVVLHTRNDTRERLDTLCQKEGIRPPYVLKLNQLLTTYHLTEYGTGISLVSDTLVKALPENPSVIYYKLDAPEARRGVYLYYKKNTYLTKSMQEFIKIVIDKSNF